MSLAIEEKTSQSTKYNKKDIEYKIEIATQTLERNIGFVTNCDNKTSIVLAIIGVLLTIILTSDGLNTIYDIITSCINEKNFCNILYLIVFVVIVFIMLFGMYNLCSVLIAKTAEEAQGLDSTNSCIFFSGIKKSGDFKSYKEKFCAMDQQELLDELLAQIYINADIAKQKYDKYNIGIKLTVAGFVFFVVVLLIGIYFF